MTSVRSIRALTKCVIKSCYCTVFLGALFFGVISVGSVKANPAPIPPNFVVEDGDVLRLAIKLETEFWTAVQTHDLGQLSDILAPEFQGFGGVFDVISRIQEIQGLMDSTLTGFLLSNVVATRNHKVLVITYFLMVSENSTIIPGPTLSTWKKTKDGWQMVSHAFVGAVT